ncbi:hypothetical protein [Reichenbachiella sp. MALMAid0571]|uniref:hypothetical protein n=1 Tax=Reichenbachiella sp. MALMAid0571 TaxID=3143939 RepID=UPI0032DEF064
MLRLVGLLIAFALFNESGTSFKEGSNSSIDLTDSVEIELHQVFDSLGLLNGYKAHIFTPICEKDKCYAVEIDFSWDPIGRFLRYDTIPGQELTKLDHEPFTNVDYIKLQNILSNPNSVLSKYTKDNLVKDTRTSEVDGVTGATIQEVKDNVIEGAVYSCYALWHIANGSVVDSIQTSTIKLLDKNLVRELVRQADQEINYFLINNFSENDFVKYLPEVLETFQNSKGYYAKNALEKMPAKVVADSMSQSFFAKRFGQMDYFTQIALLKKLTPASLHKDLAIVLEENISDRKSYRNDIIKSLLENNL